MSNSSPVSGRAIWSNNEVEERCSSDTYFDEPLGDIPLDLTNVDFSIHDLRWHDFPELHENNFPDFFTAADHTSRRISSSHQALPAPETDICGATTQSILEITHAPTGNRSEETHPARLVATQQKLFPRIDPPVEILAANDDVQAAANMEPPINLDVRVFENVEVDNEIDSKSKIRRTDNNNFTLLARFKRSGFYYKKIYVKHPKMCNLCPQTFADEDSLYRHFRKSHKLSKNNLKDCTKSIPIGDNVTDVTIPILYHGTKSGNAGTENESDFSGEKALSTDHVVTPVTTSPRSPQEKSLQWRESVFFACETCGYSSKHKLKLTRHVDLTHLKLRKHVCKCGRDFQTKQKMANHSKRCECSESHGEISWGVLE